MEHDENQERKEYYREMYRVAEISELSSLTPRKLNPKVLDAAQRHFERTMQRLQSDTRVKPFRVATPDAQEQYIASHYAMSRPRGIGVYQGEYATLAHTENDGSNQFIATDNLIDCHALVLVARDARGQAKQSLLAHIDAKTDVKKTVAQLMTHMPKGMRVEATVLGSPNSYNYYLQADLMEALAATSQIHSIRYGFDAATTVAVDISTGHILTATGPIKTANEAYVIKNLPVSIAFGPNGNDAQLVQSVVSGHFFRLVEPVPVFGLWQSYDTLRGLRSEDAMASFVLERQRNDGMLDGAELREIAAHIGSVLRAPIRLDYTVEQDGIATINIRTYTGTLIDHFVSAKIDPALGSSGTIDPTNTLPAPGRAPARDTMSPPSGRVPTGRR